MADYIEPTKTSFNAAEQVAIDAVTQTAPTLLTKTGSVIRELIIRPIAYLLSWASGNVDNSLNKYSIVYLKTSQLTVNPVADLVASNYFVERRQATPSKGVITLTLETSALTIASGARFTVAGVQVCTTKQCIILASTASYTDTDTTIYIQAIPLGVNYMANIPVEAVNPGKIEIPVGSDVILNFSCPYFVTADLTSPITGGSGTETDAEMMKRCEHNTAAAGIGTYYGIKKKMSKAPVNVFGLSVIAGEDKPLFRSRYNSVNINPGGYIDCHVKTSNQAVTESYPIDLTVSGGTTYTGIIDSTVCPGFIRIASVYAGGANQPVFNVTYGTTDPLTNADGARLSVSQTAEVTFDSSVAISGSTADVYMTYMPGLSQLQEYVNKDTEHFIGQDIKVKAAVPVALHVGCTVHSSNTLTDDELTGIRQAIVDYINGMEVGTGIINFSDIRAAVLVSFPDVDLRLPCVIQGDLMTKDGAIDTIVSNTGIFDIRYLGNPNYWGYQVCFFSGCLDNMRLNVI